MKKAVFILILLWINNLFACSCVKLKILDRIQVSEFIATAKILKVSPDLENNNLHDIEIEIIDMFKGNAVRTLKIHSALNGGCAFFTPTNSEWLIFASKNKNGALTFGRCSDAKQINIEFDSIRLEKYPNVEISHRRNIERKIEILQYLKSENIILKNEFGLHSSFSLQSMKRFKGFKVDKEKFALYEIAVDKNLNVLDVKELKGFDNIELDNELLKFIKSEMHIDGIGNLDEIPEKTKIFLGLYYYPPENGNPSFIGTWAL